MFAHLKAVLKQERAERVPERHHPWPYASRRKLTPEMKRPPAPARVLRKALHKLGMHPDDPDAREFDLFGRRALVIATNHGTLDIGKPTGVFASEMTVPYYAFFDAGMDVDVASPLGGVIPVDPQSLKPVLRAPDDDRFLADDVLRGKVTNSLAIADLDMANYDIVYLAGGWGAAFDLGFSEALADQITQRQRTRQGHRRGVPRPARIAQCEGHRRRAARQGSQGVGGDRQAGARARYRIDPAASRDRVAGDGCAVRECVTLP